MDICFADKGKKCSALTFKNCNGCNFYKSQEQHKADVGKATKRIKTLDTCNSIVSFYKLEE